MNCSVNPWGILLPGALGLQQAEIVVGLPEDVVGQEGRMMERILHDAMPSTLARLKSRNFWVNAKELPFMTLSLAAAEASSRRL